MSTPLERVKLELAELTTKYEALYKLRSGSKPTFISDFQWLCLEDQLEYMNGYKDVLELRIAKWND